MSIYFIDLLIMIPLFIFNLLIFNCFHCSFVSAHMSFIHFHYLFIFSVIEVQKPKPPGYVSVIEGLILFSLLLSNKLLLAYGVLFYAHFTAYPIQTAVLCSTI